MPGWHAARDMTQLETQLREDFAAYPYDVSSGEVPASDLTTAVRDQLVAITPFKGDIYQPTAKIGLEAQIRGMRRVQELVKPANLAATSGRFDQLRRRLQESGVKRVFVIGNGPSLKKTDLSLLRDEVTIGFNGIFLHDSFTPTIYVVEDHLVAEDRQKEILAYRCPVKVFPSYLAYCLEPQANTIFLNHRSRVSFPVDTDFSDQAGTVSYTGGTVTYTGLQIAASLGAEQIVLVGVDASYTVADVERNDSYGTGVLTSKSDDTNHFDPRYFGAGYRWHDPNVHTMLQAYRKAQQHARRNGFEIINATAGGQLEVFPRVRLEQLLGEHRSAPRVAIVDFTPATRLCATGKIKQNLLRGWAKSSLLHVASDAPGSVHAFRSIRNDLYAKGADERSLWPAFRSLLEFDPDVLYLRPTADRLLMTVVQCVAAALLGKPYVVHYMDDWLARLQHTVPATTHQAYKDILLRLFHNAHRVLAISSGMAAQLSKEHGLVGQQVAVVHNFVSPFVASAGKSQHDKTRVIRYFGGIERDMSLATVLECARQVEAAADTLDVRLEIFTTEHGIARHGAAFQNFSRTRVRPQLKDDQAYLEQLADADLNLICYNFDAASVRYVRFSLANKLPDLLSVGAPFIAIGHAEIGTIKLLTDAGYPLVCCDADFDLAQVIRRALMPDEVEQATMASAHSVLMSEFSDESNRIRFQATLRTAAQVQATSFPYPSNAIRTLLKGSSIAWAPALAAELEALMRLPMISRPLANAMLERIRTHGLNWSVRDEVAAMLKAAPSVQALRGSGPEVQARCLACLICTLGVDRFEKLNGITRDWLTAEFPDPGIPPSADVSASSLARR